MKRQNIWEKMWCIIIFFNSSCRWIPAQDEDSPFADSSKHSVGRQSVISGCGSIMTADRVLFPVGESILSRDRVLYPPEQASWRPTEYYICRSKHCDGRQSVISYRSKHRDGRQSAISGRSKHRDGRQSVISVCGSILTADRVLYSL